MFDYLLKYVVPAGQSCRPGIGSFVFLREPKGLLGSFGMTKTHPSEYTSSEDINSVPLQT
jgi:hypothetical protein